MQQISKEKQKEKTLKVATSLKLFVTAKEGKKSKKPT